MALPVGDHELADAQRAVDDPDVADPAASDLVDDSAVLVAAERPRQVELDEAVRDGRRVVDALSRPSHSIPQIPGGYCPVFTVAFLS